VEVQTLNSQLQDQSRAMENMQRQMNASTTGFYGSVCLDAAHTRLTSASSNEKAKNKQKEEDLAAYPGEDITHLYARSHLKLQKVWDDLQSFRDTYDSMLENKVNQVLHETGFMDSELRKNIESECTAEWVKQWLDNLALFRRVEAAFIKRRGIMIRLGLIDTLPKIERYKDNPDHEKWDLPVILPEREGRDIPVYTGDDPEDGTVESLAPSEFEYIKQRTANQRSDIERWIAKIVWSQLPSEMEVFAQQHMEETNDLNVMPWDSLSEAESIPHRKKTIKEYQQSFE
jgi:hypothetical protein